MEGIIAAAQGLGVMRFILAMAFFQNRRPSRIYVPMRESVYGAKRAFEFVW